jgi:hypothetical protein
VTLRTSPYTLLGQRDIDIVTFRDCQKIEAAEVARSREGAPREQFVDIAKITLGI